MDLVRRSAPAKLNLVLAVGPPRAGDGFHPICSWFVAIALADELSFERLREHEPSRYKIHWANDAPKPSTIDWPIEKDLAVRAHRLLERETGKPLPLAMTITKRIPVGGGLGGGSSDAAAALMAIRDLYSLPLRNAELRRLGLTLGSDVPYFIADARVPMPAVVQGVGEQIEPMPSIRNPPEVMLFLPPFGCPTGLVYRAFDSIPASALRTETVLTMARSGRIDSGVLFNDLAIAAEQVVPPLTDIRRLLADCVGAPVHITGSGSTMFLILEPAVEINELKLTETARRLDLVIVRTHLIG